MPTKSKSSKASSGKKPQVKVADLKPAKDAKGGRAGRGHHNRDRGLSQINLN